MAQGGDDLRTLFDLAQSAHGRIDAGRSRTDHLPKGGLSALPDGNWDQAQAAFLLTDQSGFVTCQTLRVDGGLTRSA